MRRLDCARPVRTATGQARNAGEAVQQLAHIARERKRLAQERTAIMRRIRKIDSRLEAMTSLEGKLLPMMRKEGPPANAAPTPTSETPRPAPPRRIVLPLGISQSTLQY